MKLIKPSFEILEQKPRAIAIPDDMEIGPEMVHNELLNSIYRQIELAGRNCYKSEDKITEDSAKGFVDRMIKSGHGAMLEHGTVYLIRSIDLIEDIEWEYKYRTNHYTKIVYKKDSNCAHKALLYITTNLRVLVENDWMYDLKYVCEPTEFHAKRVTVKFTTEIGITREFNRHRVNSMGEESTRYCNYSKNKFGNEISVGLPQEFNENQIANSKNEFSAYYWSDTCNDFCEYYAFRGMCKALSDGADDDFNIIDTWLFGNLACEWSYFRLLKLGWKPQQARKILPLDLKSELIHTAFISDWEHFFELRCDKAAHPDAQALAKPLHEEFIKRGYLEK